MDFTECFESSPLLLMEGALGERLKREYGLTPHPSAALASMVESSAGRAALGELWAGYARIALEYGLPFLATTPTRRANRRRLSGPCADGELNRRNADFLLGLRERMPGGLRMYVGGLMGCRGDAYTGDGAMGADDAAEFHFWQAERLRDAGVEFLFSGIMPTLPEAVGMARAMSDTGLPYIISFTIQADGRLVDGAAITDGITAVDGAAERPPVCYMSNCVHPDVVHRALDRPFNRTDAVRRRFLGVQGNTSPLPLCELDGAPELKSSPPEEFAAAMLRLRRDHGLKIFGGCCGTDDRHMRATAAALMGSAPAYPSR